MTGRVSYKRKPMRVKNKKERIISDPKIMMGKPIIAGTSFTVEMILKALASGSSVEQILKQHPGLTSEDIAAALEFAGESLNRRGSGGAIFESEAEDFWREKTLEELAQEQGVEPFRWENAFGKGADLWDDDDDFDAFIKEIAQIRKEGI